MYNNSPRMGIPLKSQTPPLLGPTTYIICDGRQTLKNRTPFLSTEKREPSFVLKPSCNTLYTLPDDTDRRLGSSPRNTDKRFVNLVNEDPGPGEYDPQGPKCSSDIPRPMGRGKLYACRVPYNLKCSGPSVPTKINANGYFLDEHGDVFPLPPDWHDNSIGPAFYNVVKKPAVDRYKGCKWSTRSEKRFVYAVENYPGPSSYDVKLPACSRDVDNDEFRAMARLLSFVPRFLDAQEMKLKKEDLPGPANYDISRDVCKRCDSINPKPFINASKRFKEISNDTPSPDTYSMSKTEYPVSKKETGFHVVAERFPRKKINMHPGPDEYDIKSPILEKLQKAVQYSGLRPPFSNSSIRNTLGLSEDIINNPCPFDYTVSGENKCRILVSSVFKSKVKRFPKKCGKMVELSPAHYNPVRAFKYIRDQQSHNIFEIPFKTKQKKKSIIDSDNENPSPADYLSQQNIGSKGGLIPVSQRFLEDTRNIPGPGTYWIHPYYDNSVNKAYTTHNLNIRESILKRKLRWAPRETRERWAASLKRRQKMRWFVNDGKGYVHC